MAVATAGTASTGYANTANTTPTLPASMGSGDYNVTLLYIEDTVISVTVPTGYTSIGSIAHTPGNAFRAFAAYRKWQSGDGNPQWTHTTAWTMGFCIRVTGADDTTFLDPASPGTAQGSGTTTHGVSAGITTANANTGLMLFNSNWSGGNYTDASWSSPLTEKYDPASTQGAIGFGVQASAGASGGKTATGPNTDFASILFGIKEAAAAGQDTPELRGRPFGLAGQSQQQQLLSQ